MKNIVPRIIACIYIILNIVFMGLMYYVDMLPTKYFLPLLIIVVVFCCGLSFVLIKRTKPKKKCGGKIVASIFAFLFSILLLFANSYIIKTMGIFDNMNLKYNVKNYSVTVLKNSKYNKLENLKNKKIGYFANDLENKSVIDTLNEKVKLNFVSYDSLSDLANDLLKKKIDAIVLEDSYKAMLLDQNEVKNEALKDFDKKTKIIYTFKLKVETKEIKKDINVREEPFNIYISGIDTYGEVASVSRSDVNIIVTINPTTNQILLTTIPRDYYVQLYNTTGSKDKLTHAGMYGIDTSVTTIEDLLDIDINYYLKVNFTSLTDIVNALDGVEVYSKYSFLSAGGSYFKEGYNFVDGKAALDFARERYSFIDADRQRGKNQQALIEAIFKKCISPSILPKYTDLLESVDGSFATNMSSDKLTSLIKKQLENNASWTINSNSLNGADGSEYTYTYSASKLYVMIPDEESISNAKSLIKQVMNGEAVKPLEYALSN